MVGLWILLPVVWGERDANFFIILFLVVASKMLLFLLLHCFVSVIPIHGGYFGIFLQQNS